MKSKILCVCALTAFAGGASAQSTTTASHITFALSWHDTGNNNGILEPGESALLSMDASFTDLNTVAQFTPHVGTFGSGTIRGFGVGFLDLNGSATGGGNAAGAWNVDQKAGYGVNLDWEVTGGYGNGTPANNGANLLAVQFGQWVTTPAFIRTTNPIAAIWTGLWTPASYDARNVTFSTAAAGASGGFSAALSLRLSISTMAVVFLIPQNITFGSVTIPTVPAPSVFSLAGLGALITARRRRRVVMS